MGTQRTAPQSLIELQEKFRTEGDCEEYLIALRWPGGFECPECGFPRAACNEKRRMLQCPNCRPQTCLTAGSIMEKTHTPLKTWFYAAYLVITLTPGISATQLPAPGRAQAVRDRLSASPHALLRDGKSRPRAAALRGRSGRNSHRRWRWGPCKGRPFHQEQACCPWRGRAPLRHDNHPTWAALGGTSTRAASA